MFLQLSQAKIDMACLKLLLSSSLTFIVTTAVVVVPDSVWIMRDSILPEHYNIKLATYINDNIFYGENNISINLRHPTYHIYLHAENLCVIDMLLITNIESIDKDNEDFFVSKPISFYDNKTKIFNLYFAEKLLPGRYILNTKFRGIMVDNGEIRTFHKERRERIALYTATDFQTFGIRQIFPCWDDPVFHATFNISIMHHKNYKVLSNMPVKREEVDENDMMWTHFDTTPAIPTYLVGMIIADKSKYNALAHESTSNITIWFRSNTPHLYYAQYIIQYFTLFLQLHSKHKRLNSKVNHVAISNFQDKGTVNLGLILYRESDIMYLKDKDPVAQKFEVTRLIGYKISQELFHNVLNSTWCDTLWLNEAFVSFFGVHTIDEIFPDFGIMNLYVVQVRHEAFHLHADFDVWSSMSQVRSTFEMLHHFKALVIFRMLQHTYTHQLFWDAIYICIYNYEYDWLSKYDFWTALGIAYISGQTWTPPLNQEEFDYITKQSTQLRSWMMQENYLVLWVTRNYKDSMDLITIQIFNATEDLVVPMAYTTQSRLNFNTMRRFWQNVKSDKLPQIFQYRMQDLKRDDWIIFNLQQTGYYRVYYDYENWDRISKYLNSEQYKNIHVLNRALIIDDAFYFMITRQYDSSRFWRLVHYLWRETEYVAWYPMFKALEYMSIIFLFDKYDEGIDYIKTDIRNILHGILREGIEYIASPYEHEFTNCIREEAAKWACLLGHNMCREMAETAFEYDRDGINKIVPWWKHWVYCNILILDELKIWREIYDKWVNKFDHEISRFLLCTENVHTIKIYLSLLLDLIKESENHSLRLQAINNFLLTIAKHVRSSPILTHILNNFEKMVSREIGTVVTLIVITNNLYTEEQLDVLYDFVTSDLYEPLAEVTESDESEYILPRTEESKAEELSKVQDKIKLRYNEVRSLKKFLQIFNKVEMYQEK